MAIATGLDICTKERQRKSYKSGKKISLACSDEMSGNYFSDSDKNADFPEHHNCTEPTTENEKLQN